MADVKCEREQTSGNRGEILRGAMNVGRMWAEVVCCLW